MLLVLQREFQFFFNVLQMYVSCGPFLTCNLSLIEWCFLNQVHHCLLRFVVKTLAAETLSNLKLHFRLLELTRIDLVCAGQGKIIINSD